MESSDVPGISLVPVPFSETNFGSWKRSSIVSLSARNKVAFVDGSLPKPPDNSIESKQWDRCNNMVISWLTSSLSPDIADSVQYSETTEEIWRYLNKRYEIVSGTKDFEIKTELASTIKEGILKEEEEDRLHQFLMGLNAVYVSVRSNLLMMQPPPTQDSAYNILLQDERQRQINSNSQFGPNSAAFTAKINHQSSPNTNYKPPCSNTQRQYVQKVNFDQAKGNIFCRYWPFSEDASGSWDLLTYGLSYCLNFEVAEIQALLGVSCRPNISV
uniref:Retrotransposon Copia-like N-terminal domain-containing protein n=1 Tax=Nicotiana tabacum TaxID=4097 RepID=A0A1S4AWM8_TOBAC|nr:PREDICTED: uncharacterized protein LOC107802095 [Nicotiana tabacum]